MNQFENSSQSYDFSQINEAWFTRQDASGPVRQQSSKPASVSSPIRRTSRAREVILVRRYYSSTQPLIRLIAVEAIRRGYTIQRMAEELNITHGYINQLDTGIRRMNDISPRMVAAFAEVLSIPKLLVHYLAGKLTEDDLAELDSIGAKTADYLSELTERVESQAKEVLAATVERLCERYPLVPVETIAAMCGSARQGNGDFKSLRPAVA